jgi:hypothetical protein
MKTHSGKIWEVINFEHRRASAAEAQRLSGQKLGNERKSAVKRLGVGLLYGKSDGKAS